LAENDKELPENLFIKGMPRRQMRRRDLGDEPSPRALQVAANREKRERERAEEVAEAMTTPYYWWWVFLQESDEYRAALERKKVDPAVAAVARDFGDITKTSFETWWFKTGRYLFAQKRAMPKVRKLENGTTIWDAEKNNCLYLEIPLTMRRSTALRKINEILGEHFKAEDGGRHNVFAYSQARRDINKSSKVRITTFKQFHDVWMDRKNYPDSQWWETGEKFKISPSFINYPHTHPMDRAENCRNMNLTVQRIYRKTKTLIYWAARGEFPRIK
jgi:hypothetical protein